MIYIHNKLASHELRLHFGLFPFFAAFRFPLAVVGPVDAPPWNLHRPFLKRTVIPQGSPLRFLAPQII